MSSDRLGSNPSRFGQSHGTQHLIPDAALNQHWEAATTSVLANAEATISEDLGDAIERTTRFFLNEQHEDGYWVGELQGDTILESEYILLLAFLGREQSETAKAAARYILQKQESHGGWALYPQGPLEISASVKAYFALKLTGHSPDAAYMQQARTAILAAGGAEGVNSFTRYYLALLGQLSYQQCPAIPPEIMLIPHWCPFNIYEMSSWSRTILVPMSLMWAYQPQRKLPEEKRINELFVNAPAALSLSMPKPQNRDFAPQRSWLDWDRFFLQVDRAIKLCEQWGLKPLRSRGIDLAKEWMLTRCQGSDGLGAIFPPIIWTVVALKCLGYEEESPEIRTALHELEKLFIDEDDTLRLQPCQSPVWDTAITLIALRDADVPWNHASIRKAVNWLLSKEVKQPGDWSVRQPNTPVGGWCFEFNNDFYPDIDDTSMVTMALSRCLPDSEHGSWSTDFLLESWSPHDADRDASAIVAARRNSAAEACLELEQAVPMLTAIWRGARWVMALQSKDGGWGAFDRDNNRHLFTRVPFADHNAMIDPSTADITARVLEMFGQLQITQQHPGIQRAIQFVWQEQEADHCWYGRWGVNYIYGTWQCIVGLTGIGVAVTDTRIQSAVHWLKATQQATGGWGETVGSYDNPALRGYGQPTASQTAWALLGLIAAGQQHSLSVKRGIQFLLETQNSDGTWSEDQFTGTGFPKVFYLRYHLYRNYFPLMALGRYQTAIQFQATAQGK